MTESRFRLVSDAFGEGEHIPREYGCDGDGHSPPLRWNGAPEATRSFVLRVVDPDAPDGEFTHWVLFDLPASTGNLETGDSGEGVEGRNDFQSIGWGGPCPPPRHGDHRYYFTLSALDCETLDLPEGATRAEVEKKMEGHVLDEVTRMGRYRRD
jgi:Raf kinase inhibitor-like YbhB/YbcL family protein